ncbi:MAG: alpha/beta hydrolase [Prosthecobacter sp.]|jgi:pimeloyl-ACP methyl ester carboxylesterase|uniref:esterase/lipase family protein n=1 Tax=Prosthecobacter sp. TaxID=1965333 RepID=UPI0019DD2A94|nr:alpha/beta hydrolase [Prosthecobacter sp.]MBE2287770.1 alpha/beta hydrolase [Prosthecobacter sp.]
MSPTRVLLISGWLLLSSGCAIAPAKITRVVEPEKASLHEWMQAALANEGTNAAKVALGHFIERWRKSDLGAEGIVRGEADSRGPVFHVVFSKTGQGAYSPAYFDKISPAADYEVLKIPHHVRRGAGVPLVAIRENRERDPIEAYYPPETIARPLTALLKPGKAKAGVQEVHIDLLCPLVHDSVVHNGRRQPLAADFSLPWAATLSKSGKLNQLRVLDMVTPLPKRTPQLYLMEPYDRRKEPLIMIHGLLSSPLAWAKLSNELWADDRIRNRYQIWHFLYNTSAPSLYSSSVLRRQLAAVRRLLDPERDDPAMRHTTLVTHSMGGLVGKALAMEPGEAFWKATFTVTADELKLSTEDRSMLKDAFEWHADPTIHRIIFIATPHRGSEYADTLIGRLGSVLTQPPRAFQQFYRRVATANPDAFTPEYTGLAAGKLDSVSSLSPRQPTLRLLAELPYAHRVHVHSIIGNRGRPGPLDESSDGFVPYSSSHLEGADSELVVPSRHRVFRHPEAIAEVRRILKL